LNLGTANGLEDGMATTAHEVQHMIHWNYNKLGDTFTNEGCSLMAEVICGFPLYTQSLFEGEPNHYLFDWRRNNLTLALNDYSRAARFFLYLKEQFGAALLKTIVQTNLAGSERLDAALAAYSPPTARRFADIFQDWLLANSVNNRSVDTKWGYLSSSVATVLPIVFISPNVPSTGDTVANLGGLYLSFRAGMSLTTTIASGAPSGDFFLRAIEKGPSGVRVLPVTLGSPFSEPAFGSGYTDVTFLVGGINPSLPRNITYSSSGTDAAAELKWDETEPVGYLPIAAGDSVCVQFDGYAGARLDSVRVALRRTGSITGGIWRSSGVVQPTPLGTPLAVPIQVSGSMNPPTPYPVPWPNWGSADVHSLNIDASQPFVAAFACTGLPSVDNRIMVTLQAGSGPYHSFTTSSGSWVYYTNTTGDSLFLYMVRAYVSIPTGVGREAIELRPTSTGLFQNFPNPFNPSTKIRYTLAERRPVVLRVFDVLGRDVRTLVSEVQAPGTYETIWDGRDARGAPVTSGVYYYRLEAGPFTRTERMVFLK
jgi:hypothetical protein